jgi:hypothetical protein
MEASRGRGRRKIEIRVNGTLLRQVEVFKYLGFLVTPTFSSAAHVTRALEKARAAAATIAPILKRLKIFEFKRLGSYLGCFVESQFYGIELLPPNALDALASARSNFVRSVLDLPRSASHELTTILFDSPPLELLLLRRISAFIRTTNRHEFEFVRDAIRIDRDCLINNPISLHGSLHRIIRRFNPTFSLATDNLYVAMENILVRAGHPQFIFQFIKTSDLLSLSFFTLFRSRDVLVSYRNFLQSLPWDQARILLLFSSSLLRFRFCDTPRELCPLCGKVWLWEHFFTCRFLEVAPGLNSSTQVLVTISDHISLGQWEVFVQYVRFYLLEWHELVRDPAVSLLLIDSLCL